MAEPGGLHATKENRNSVSYRQILKSKLEELGYSEKEIKQVLSEFSDEEIAHLVNHPDVLVKTGAYGDSTEEDNSTAYAIVGLLLLGLTTTALVSKSKSSSSGPTVITKKLLPCPECNKADCPECKGNKICPTCGGTGKSGIKDDWGKELPCKTCDGRGYLNETCPVCGGDGFVEE